MLQIKYKNGMIRNLRVTPDFFISGKTHETLPKGELTGKILDIVNDFGPYKELYEVSLTNGARQIIHIGPNLHNKPNEFVEEEKIDESVQIKQMKKETKNQVFTHSIKWTASGAIVTMLK